MEKTGMIEEYATVRRGHREEKLKGVWVDASNYPGFVCDDGRSFPRGTEFFIVNSFILGVICPSCDEQGNEKWWWSKGVLSQGIPIERPMCDYQLFDTKDGARKRITR